eukprot:1176559-Prorocentrum_minimum.AAC.2
MVRALNGTCAEWNTSVDSRRLSTVELKSKAFLAVDSGAWSIARKNCIYGRYFVLLAPTAMGPTIGTTTLYSHDSTHLGMLP